MACAPATAWFKRWQSSPRAGVDGEQRAVSRHPHSAERACSAALHAAWPHGPACPPPVPRSAHRVHQHHCGAGRDPGVSCMHAARPGAACSRTQRLWGALQPRAAAARMPAGAPPHTQPSTRAGTLTPHHIAYSPCCGRVTPGAPPALAAAPPPGAAHARARVPAHSPSPLTRLHGLPWLQAALCLCGGAAVALLWLTYLVDPGLLEPSADKGVARLPRSGCHQTAGLGWRCAQSAAATRPASAARRHPTLVLRRQQPCAPTRSSASA